MECSECNARVDGKWEFCPKCGNNLRQTSGDAFAEIFEQFGQEFTEMNKMIEKQMEVVDLSPFFRKQKSGQHGGGFSIKIMASGNRPPQISVNTFGDVDEKRIKQQVYSQLGVPEKARGAIVKEAHTTKHPKVKAIEEPRSEVKKTGQTVSVNIDLPGVKSERDIQINDMENSVEVKAIVNGKAFFKILKKPEGFGIAHKRFENGKLHLEFG